MATAAGGLGLLLDCREVRFGRLGQKLLRLFFFKKKRETEIDFTEMFYLQVQRHVIIKKKVQKHAKRKLSLHSHATTYRRFSAAVVNRNRANSEAHINHRFLTSSSHIICAFIQSGHQTNKQVKPMSHTLKCPGDLFHTSK